MSARLMPRPCSSRELMRPSSVRYLRLALAERADGSLLVAKFTSRNDTSDVETMEVVTLQLAALCGLNAPEARLDRSDDLPVALIKRFDHGRGRRPYISAQTFLGAEDAVSGTYVDIAETMRRHRSIRKRIWRNFSSASRSQFWSRT